MRDFGIRGFMVDFYGKIIDSFFMTPIFVSILQYCGDPDSSVFYNKKCVELGVGFYWVLLPVLPRTHFKF